MISLPGNATVLTVRVHDERAQRWSVADQPMKSSSFTCEFLGKSGSQDRVPFQLSLEKLISERKISLFYRQYVRVIVLRCLVTQSGPTLQSHGMPFPDPSLSPLKFAQIHVH